MVGTLAGAHAVGVGGVEGKVLAATLERKAAAFGDDAGAKTPAIMIIFRYRVQNWEIRIPDIALLM